MTRLLRSALILLLGSFILPAQTTQGLISGSILNSVTGRPLNNATVTFNSTTLTATGAFNSDETGSFFLPSLSPGTYTIRAAAPGYQAQELQQLDLAVAGRIQVDFRLRPLSDVWEAGQYRSVFLPGSKTIVTFYGPDVDTSRSGSFEGQQGKRGTLDTSVSYVIDPAQISDLPLQGRDVYTMLVSLPGVTANNGTSRGLGISVAGQRPSASNYLLDGVENNNYLITGPLSPVAPEAIQEYRISTNNYSAEYGQTAGFIANAVTRAGTTEFHGIGYEYLKNDALNAADFGDNLTGAGRRKDDEHQFGYQVGGPILKNRLFFSSALEQFISDSRRGPATYYLPTRLFISALNIQPARLSGQLLQKFQSPVFGNTKLPVAPYTVQQPIVLDRLIALERADYSFRGGRDHLMARVAIARTTEPDFIWSPYPDFISPLHQNTTGLAGNWTHSWTPRLTTELKAGFSDDTLQWDRAHPEIPNLASGDGVTLPGSPSFFSYRNHNRTPEAALSGIWTRNRHVISAGGSILRRLNDGFLKGGSDGAYIFGNDLGFAFDAPQFFQASIDRLSSKPVQPPFDRSYAYNQSYFYIQDSWRATSRLTLNFGLRYERYGAPSNTGAAKDALLVLGAGGNFTSRLATSSLQAQTQIYGADNKDFAPRFGFSFDPLGNGKTVINGGFGIFYDRPFDNLWQNVRNNRIVLPLYSVTSVPTNYLQSISTVLPSYASQFVDPASFPNLTLMDPKLRNGYAQTFFIGLQHSVNENLTIQVNGTGALDRRLITTDVVNRQFTTLDGIGRPNPNLPDVSWRSGQGKSDYSALNAIVKYRRTNYLLQGAYTWSHSIDNQSDPLVGDFFALDFSAVNTSGNTAGLKSSFAQQYNSNADRGNSDFDQRHNFYLLGVYQSVARNIFLRGWQTSGMAALRTGLPYTVTTITTNAPDFGGGVVQNQRADLLNPSNAFLSSPVPVAGGVQVLNAAAFREPLDASVIGTSGRNAFRGPGLYNLDLSLSRTFSVPRMREGTRLTLRADAFNILNHANLNNPDSLLGSPSFGIETYGRLGSPSGFPAVSPVNETARQVQLLVRLEF